MPVQPSHQEYLRNTHCEILKPSFINNNSKINIKDYIEVNSAISLALQGLEKNVNINFTKESLAERAKMLLKSDYVSNNEISTTLYLSLLLGKPMLIEGPPGVGKTELAKVIAKSFERDFFRIQCYEGITFEQIVGEWNYQKQLLHLEAARNEQNSEEKIFDEEKRKALYKEQKRSTTIVKEERIYPNDPCPCGSGKKYKKCCGRN